MCNTMLRSLLPMSSILIRAATVPAAMLETSLLSKSGDCGHALFVFAVGSVSAVTALGSSKVCAALADTRSTSESLYPTNLFMLTLLNLVYGGFGVLGAYFFKF